MARRVLGALILVGVSAVAPTAAAQRPTTSRPRPAPQRPTTSRPVEDSTTRKDTALVHWVPADSVAAALMARKGYLVVRYQAEFVTFGAADRTITLIGRPAERAVVEREPTLLVADTIQYSDSTNQALSRGPAIVIREKGRDDVNASGRMAYDVTRKQGTATNIRTVENSGERWVVTAHVGGFAGDSAAGSATYGRAGTLTSCEDSLPHYHFKSTEIKYITKHMLVARPAVLYLQGVPVFWLPFVFQDIRSGRRSGILTPRFGFAELVRNSPTYRRNIEDIGYYFAINDYLDVAVSMDWRSSARATIADPGWLRLNSQMRYHWLNRFMTGGFAVSRHALSTGSSNLQLSWNHSQDFSSTSRITSNLNYVTSTAVQRQTALNPVTALATIGSQVNYSKSLGPFAIAVGGARRQYPGRAQVDQDFPSLNVSSKAIRIAPNVDWTPAFNFANATSTHLDAQGDFTKRYFVRNGALDSARFERATRSTSGGFNSPFKIGSFNLPFSLTYSDRMNDFPEVRIVVNPADTSRRETRVYRRTYLTTIDWRTAIALPTFFHGSWNLSPGVSMENVDPSGYFIRSERTGSAFVSQTKRLSWGVSVAPTFFALTSWGLGPVARFRHSLTPTLSWSMAPRAKVSDDFLMALGKTRADYLGDLGQNRLTFGLSQSFEAKLRKDEADSSSNDEGRKVKLLAINMTPLMYDFERAKKTGKSGFATERISFNLNSALIPGFALDVGYSLFEGSVLSDTAKFGPYRESISASMSLNRESVVVRWVAWLFGARAEADTRSAQGSPQEQAMGAFGQGGSQQQVAGTGRGQQMQQVPVGRGFEAQISLSSNRQRPPGGDGRVVEYDPYIQCELLKVNPVQYEVCVRNALIAPPVDYTKFSPTTAGGSFFRIPPQTSINWRTSFDLTPKWSASWNTSYDAVRKEFASHQVTLQRDLHDWSAMFGFTQAPNGNFAFTFFVALKAEPDLKFNYDRQSYQQRLLPPP